MAFTYSDFSPVIDAVIREVFANVGKKEEARHQFRRSEPYRVPFDNRGLLRWMGFLNSFGVVLITASVLLGLASIYPR